MTLNLTTSNKGEELIKEYLEINTSEELAEKINKGTPFVKDGKQYINKKTLSGFLDYANDKAKKLAEKNKDYALFSSDVVFYWAIHYFEEDSIEGKLYNPDGTEYVPPKPVYTPKPITTTPTAIKPEPKPQMSIFDMFNDNKPVVTENVLEDITEEDIAEAMEELQPTIDDEVFSDKTVVIEEKPKKLRTPVYQSYMHAQSQYPDCIIVYRLGDFYEVFGQNAVKIAGVLDLTLTGRECGLDERVPMVGFPYHIADKYVSKLVELGYKVAIVDSQDKIEIKEYNQIEKPDYIDDDGVVHEDISSMDNAVVAIWKNLLGDELAV